MTINVMVDILTVESCRCQLFASECLGETLTRKSR